jgi:hypothetical protein
MEEQLQEDWLDARLREEAPYIDDGGFTAQVMQKLPAPQPKRSFRGVILVGLTLLASGLTYFFSGGGQFVIQVARQVAGTNFLLLCEIAVSVGCS